MQNLIKVSLLNLQVQKRNAWVLQILNLMSYYYMCYIVDE